VPATLDLPSINLFATMTFAFAGLELAPTLGDEIHDPAATLRRGIAVSGLAIVAMYVLGTAAMLVALPQATVSITNGVPQATAALFVIASLVGSTVKNAYLVLTQTTIVLFFIPYLYLFLAYLRLRRARTHGTAFVGVIGCAAVLLSIVLGFVPPADEARPWI